MRDFPAFVRTFAPFAEPLALSQAASGTVPEGSYLVRFLRGTVPNFHLGRDSSRWVFRICFRRTAWFSPAWKICASRKFSLLELILIEANHARSNFRDAPQPNPHTQRQPNPARSGSQTSFSKQASSAAQSPKNLCEISPLFASIVDRRRQCLP